MLALALGEGEDLLEEVVLLHQAGEVLLESGRRYALPPLQFDDHDHEQFETDQIGFREERLHQLLDFLVLGFVGFVLEGAKDVLSVNALED